MDIIKAPVYYKMPAWVTTCNECGCEYRFTRKDTHLQVIDGQREYFIQCPYCGKWRATNIK